MFIRSRKRRSTEAIEGRSSSRWQVKTKNLLPWLGTRARQGSSSMIFDNSSSPGFVIASVHWAEELYYVTTLLHSVCRWDLAAVLLARAGFLVGTRGRNNWGFCKEGWRMSLGVTRRLFHGQWCAYRTSSLATILTWRNDLWRSILWNGRPGEFPIFRWNIGCRF